MARKIPIVTEVAGLRGRIIANLGGDLAHMEDADSETYDFSGERERLRRQIAELRAGGVVELRRWGDGVRRDCADAWPAGAQVCLLDGDTLTPANYERLPLQSVPGG